MNVQSRTYNNGSVIEYIYTIIPPRGDSYKTSVFIDVLTGEIFEPSSRKLTVDEDSENSFKGVCCNDVFEEPCEGWITETGLCWVTEAELGWGI